MPPTAPCTPYLHPSIYTTPPPPTNKPHHHQNPEIVRFGRAFPTYVWNNMMNLFFTILACWYLDAFHFSPTYYHPYIATWLLMYYTFTILLRYWDTDSHVFYEQIWACNLVMIISALGMLLSIPMFTCLSCVIVAVDQMCWYVDIGVLICSGFRLYPVGVAKYLSSPQTSFAKKLTAWHHLWFLPLMLSTVGWELLPKSFLMGSLVASWMTITSRLTTPFHCLSERPRIVFVDIPNTTPGSDVLNDQTQTSNHNNNNAVVQNEEQQLQQQLQQQNKQYPTQHGYIYLNINCPYAFWEDIPLGVLHIFNHASPFFYLPYLWLIANFGLNLPAVSLLEVILAYIRRA